MNKIMIKEMVLGDTIYIVENVIGDNAKETAYDKVKRLILNNTGSLNDTGRLNDADSIGSVMSAKAARKPEYNIAS